MSVSSDALLDKKTHLDPPECQDLVPQHIQLIVCEASDCTLRRRVAEASWLDWSRGGGARCEGVHPLAVS